MAGATNRTTSDNEDPDKLYAEIGIIVLSAAVGYFWEGIVSTNHYASGQGAFAGLLFGVVLVLTARLARMK